MNKIKILERNALLIFGSLIAIALGETILILGNQQFGGCDMGVLVDVGYRLFLGQHLYSDFPSTHPLLFSLGALWSFQLFGLKWAAFVKMASMFAVVSLFIHIWILHRLGIHWIRNLFLAATVQIGAMVTCSYWWYNPMTTITASVFFSAVALVYFKSESPLNWLIYSFCLVMISLSKPNIAGPLIIMCSLILLSKNETRRQLILCSTLSLIVFFEILYAYKIKFPDMLHSYLTGASRGVPRFERFCQDQSEPLIVLSVFLLLSALLPLIYSVLVLLRRSLFQASVRRFLLLSLAVSLTSIYAQFTNGELKVVELPLLLTAAALLCWTCVTVEPCEEKRQVTNPNVLLYAALLFEISTALYQGVTRLRVRVIGEGAFYQHVALTESKNQFFSSLLCGPALQVTLADVDYFLQKKSTETAKSRLPSVFFGPRMNWAYAAFNLVPPLHLPYSWYGNVDYPLKDLNSIIEHFSDNKPEYCIFLLNNYNVDLTYIPKQMVEFIVVNYGIAFRSDQIIVLQRL
jgi:hypothetical protein